MSDIGDRVRAQVPRALDDLRAMVAIPSVSSLPDHADDVLRSAELCRDLLLAEGVEARVVTAGGSRPAVLGRKAGPPGAPTVLLYAHHDVQPVGTADWEGDPFVLTEREGRLFGRGGSDDKGALALHLAVLRAFGDELPVNVVVLIEGEEEIGSPALPAFLAAHADELRAEVVLVPDAVNPDPITPSLTTALRGNTHLDVTVATLTRPVHSGLYGGLLPCALTCLVVLLSAVFDENGHVDVAGLSADAGPPPEVLLDLAGIAVDEQPLTAAPGDAAVLRPSVTVLALDAVPVAEASNVLHASARARLGIRVPPSQDPVAVVAAIEEQLRAHCPAGAQLTLERGQQASGFSAVTHSPEWEAASLVAYGRSSVTLGAGGSIPFLAALRGFLPDAQFLVTAIQDAASRAHSSNESLHLEGFGKACVAHALLLAELGS